ncbi:uncharacterized protein LOC109801424 [Cajanus cajan]|uniref:Uncharacterized protein n=1 Tax=Cajanus cajan TaxID=3821 RepID=A0A151THE0_CAJCA|nr:uncharacterized protein LOC109801424 [Cajanus cajan]KYP66406.1 hypothetical protein KK1_012699 [Cajanus cajan]
MSLNCLTCSQLLQRTDSFGELFAEKEYKDICKQVQVDRRWPENMASSPPKRDFPKSAAVTKIKAEHRRNYSTGDVPYSPGSQGPKLKRSSGMRRNWSFEDLPETKGQRLGCH